MLACHPAEPPDPLSVKTGAIIIAATAFGAIPQLHKLASSGSSAGVSAATSGLTLTFTWFNLLATLTVKAPSLRSCADSVLRCLPSLVDALQQAETALILLAILLLVVSLPPNDGATPRRGTAALLLALLALGAAIAAIDARAPCSAPSLAAAEAHARSTDADDAAHLPGSASPLADVTFAWRGVGPECCSERDCAPGVRAATRRDMASARVAHPRSTEITRDQTRDRPRSREITAGEGRSPTRTTIALCLCGDASAP